MKIKLLMSVSAVAVGAATLVPISANAQSYYSMGNSIYGSDGYSAYSLGNSTYGSDGYSSYSLGNSTYGSDGQTCTYYGNIIFCN